MVKLEKQKMTDKVPLSLNGNTGNKNVESYLHSINMCIGYLIISSNELKEKTQAEKIILLSKLGLEKEMIAEILNTTVATVTTRISENQKKIKEGKNK